MVSDKQLAKKIVSPENARVPDDVRQGLYPMITAVGPWALGVIFYNFLRLMSAKFITDFSQLDLFWGTILYVLVFSQVLVAPWQLLVGHYLYDQLSAKTFDRMRPSFWGFNSIIFLMSSLLAVLFYLFSPMPISFKAISILLFILSTHLWGLVVYLGVARGYKIILVAFALGALLTLLCGLALSWHPVGFLFSQQATNMLLAYLVGVILTVAMLVYHVLKIFNQGKGGYFTFLQYYKKVPTLFYIGLFAVGGVWCHDVLVWFSRIGIRIYHTYQFAPRYDNILLFLYLSVIPTGVVYCYIFENVISEHYRKFIHLIASSATYNQLAQVRKNLTKVMLSKLVMIIEIQTIISILLIIILRALFEFFHVDDMFRETYSYTLLGTWGLGIFVPLLMMQLYVEARREALLTSLVFFGSNLLVTLGFVLFLPLQVAVAPFVASLLAFGVGFYYLKRRLGALIYSSYSSQGTFLWNRSGLTAAQVVASNEGTPGEDDDPQSYLMTYLLSGVLLVACFYFVSGLLVSHHQRGQDTAISSTETSSTKQTAPASPTERELPDQLTMIYAVLPAGQLFRADLQVDQHTLLVLYDKTEIGVNKRAAIVSGRINKLAGHVPLPAFTVSKKKKQVQILSGDLVVFTLTDLDAKQSHRDKLTLANRQVERLNRVYASLIQR